jgi:hypothetical protein
MGEQSQPLSPVGRRPEECIAHYQPPGMGQEFDNCRCVCHGRERVEQAVSASSSAKVCCGA